MSSSRTKEDARVKASRSSSWKKPGKRTAPEISISKGKEGTVEDCTWKGRVNERINRGRLGRSFSQCYQGLLEFDRSEIHSRNERIR